MSIIRHEDQVYPRFLKKKRQLELYNKSTWEASTKFPVMTEMQKTFSFDKKKNCRCIE